MKENLEVEVGSSPQLKLPFLDRLANLFATRARAASVFGEPVERGGVTIVPVAKVRWGFGGGGGGDAEGVHSEGGAGGGVRVDPVGYIEIEGNQTRYLPIRDPSSYVPLIVAGGFAGCLLLRGIRRLIR
jgi:uncharacterized spore protein YtfJ